MLKKNTSEKRFNTAGARLPMSRKLPSDFFKPNTSNDSQLTSHFLPLTKQDVINSQSNYKSIICDRDPLEFTFRRAASEEHTSLHEKSFRNTRRHYFGGSSAEKSKKKGAVLNCVAGKENHKGSISDMKSTLMKLPPIINFSMLKESNESAKKLVTKLKKKTSRKVSEEIRMFRHLSNDNVEI